MLLIDHALATRLERAEGTVCTTFAPGAWREIGGTFAVFDDADSPLTQTFGLGMTEPATPAILDAIEAYFTSLGAPTHHEVCPLAGVATTALLVTRGYTPIEMSSVLVRRLDRLEPPHTALACRAIGPADHATWVDTSVAGWSDDPAIAAMIRTFAEKNVANAGMTHFLVEAAGRPIGTGSLGTSDGVALLAGASTIPSARGQGAQALLLATRLAAARDRGCDLAMMGAEPGGSSQKNAERSGFAIAYTRTKWKR